MYIYLCIYCENILFATFCNTPRRSLCLRYRPLSRRRPRKKNHCTMFVRFVRLPAAKLHFNMSCWSDICTSVLVMKPWWLHAVTSQRNGGPSQAMLLFWQFFLILGIYLTTKTSNVRSWTPLRYTARISHPISECAIRKGFDFAKLVWQFYPINEHNDVLFVLRDSGSVCLFVCLFLRSGVLACCYGLYYTYLHVVQHPWMLGMVVDVQAPGQHIHHRNWSLPNWQNPLLWKTLNLPFKFAEKPFQPGSTFASGPRSCKPRCPIQHRPRSTKW